MVPSLGVPAYRINGYFTLEMIEHFENFFMMLLGMLFIETFNYATLMYVNKHT